MQCLKEKIITLLLNSGKLSREQLDKALALQKEKQVPLRTILVEQGFISEEALLSMVPGQLCIPTLHISQVEYDREIINIIPERMARQYKIFPLLHAGTILTVAMADPLNVFALEGLQTYTGCCIDMVLSSESDIIEAIDTQYQQVSEHMRQFLSKDSLCAAAEESVTESAVEVTGADMPRLQEEALHSVLQKGVREPMVEFLDSLVEDAWKRRVSDIHIDPEQDCLRIRYRIDGVLIEFLRVPKGKQNAVHARLKLLSNFDITESRTPQEGGFKARGDGREIEVRVSVLPTTFGPKFVLRLLDKSKAAFGLAAVGFSEQTMALFKQAISKPYGMIVVSGPTGSGRSTTLYTILHHLNSAQRNIVTIEDPVDYRMEGITQVQVKSDIGLDFASGVPSIVRQNPDVIMIGEIRDIETAKSAVEASLTGQVVLATLNADNAVSSITRLIDMGGDPFLVASSLTLLCAQRLARRLCDKCKRPAQMSKEVLEKIGFTIHQAVYQAEGCSSCNNTGFYGRIAVRETVMIDDVMRGMIVKREPASEITRYAIQSCGVKSLKDDAFQKVQAGITSIDEALRVTAEGKEFQEEK